jgi:nitrate reductase delta subunit
MNYPDDSLRKTIRECAALLGEYCPDATPSILDFQSFAEREGLATIEEVYTRTFDITPMANLYVGYQLFGETYKRGAFLAKLQERYRAHGFDSGLELPDHIAVVLRFASTVDDSEFVDPLITEGVLPTLNKVEEALTDAVGYGPLVKSLRSLVQQQCRELVVAGGN